MTKKAKPLSRTTKSDAASSRSSAVVDRTRDESASAARDRAEDTAESLKVPDDWGPAKVRALARDLEAVLDWERGLPPYASCPNDRAVHCAQFKRNRKTLIAKAKVFRAAAQEISEAPLALATTLLWANKYAPGSADAREGLERAAQLLLRSDPFPLKGVLLALAREAEKQAGYMASALKPRGKFTDDWFVERVAAVLINHGLKAGAYETKGSPKRAKGNLVVACAMLRGLHYYQSEKASWVVDAHERIASKRRKLDAVLAARREKALEQRRSARSKNPPTSSPRRKR